MVAKDYPMYRKVAPNILGFFTLNIYVTKNIMVIHSQSSQMVSTSESEICEELISGKLHRYLMQFFVTVFVV